MKFFLLSLILWGGLLPLQCLAAGAVADWALLEKKLNGKEAQAALDTYLKKHPEGELSARAGMLRARLEENLEKAMSYYRTAARADPDGLWGAWAVLELGKTDYTLGHYEKALLQFDTLVLDESTHELEPELWFWRAQARYVLMGVKRARRDFENVVKKYPQHRLAPAAALGAGECALAQGDLDAAYKSFLALAGPENPVGAQALWQAAQVQEKKGNPLKALEHYRQLSSRFENSFEATQARKKLQGKPLPQAKPTPRAKKILVSHYSVQLGAFSKTAGARRLEKVLKKKKLTVRVKEIDVRGTLYHVVRVGEFSTQAAAERFARGLKRREGWSYRVVAE